jgi:excisionase family DNA binding protein
VNDTDDKTRQISLPEAAKLYGFNSDYLRTLAQKGRLKAHKVGPLWVTTARDVENYIASRQKRGVYRRDIEVNRVSIFPISPIRKM